MHGGSGRRGECLTIDIACGGVFVSDVRGEFWQTLGIDLPPIYSVRFFWADSFDRNGFQASSHIQTTSSTPLGTCNLGKMFDINLGL